jgi:hypothetical protein
MPSPPSFFSRNKDGVRNSGDGDLVKTAKDLVDEYEADMQERAQREDAKEPIDFGEAVEINTGDLEGTVEKNVLFTMTDVVGGSLLPYTDFYRGDPVKVRSRHTACVCSYQGVCVYV